MDGLIFLYLAIYPFGKLTGALPDLVIGIIAAIALMTAGAKKVNNFIVICFFSLFFSLSFFKLPQIFTGVIYFMRLFGYVIFSQIVYKRIEAAFKKLLLLETASCPVPYAIVVGKLILCH